MMTLVIGFLTGLVVIDCVLLVLLVLLQLPKKEAGAGLAFGGAATDALFGAGSGNVLTRITKWVAGGFFALTLLLAVLSTKRANSASVLHEELLKKSAATAPAIPRNLTDAPAKPATPAEATPTPAPAPAPAK